MMNVKCCACGCGTSIESHPAINVREHPELKDMLLSGELFVWECPQCGRRNLVSYPVSYVDPDAGLVICVSREEIPLSADSLGGFTCRRVVDAGSLIEKVKIFDAGLDDIAVEMVKHVTLLESGKVLALKFLRLEGAEGELVFAYPENGEMMMLAVGINVYEDCRNIIARNPDAFSRKGFAIVDRDWIESLMR